MAGDSKMRNLSTYQQKPWMEKINRLPKKWPDRSGENNANRRLTKNDVRAIRKNDWPAKEMARWLDISERQIYKIRAYQAWKGI